LLRPEEAEAQREARITLSWACSTLAPTAMPIEPSMLQRNGFLPQRKSVGGLRPDRELPVDQAV